MTRQSISAIVLAGGHSRRLGMDKSLLKLNGDWLLERILKSLASLSDDLIVVANTKPEFALLPARIVPDVLPGMGPLGGIDSGLRAMRHERGLCVACDMPFLNLPLLRYMLLLSAGFDVVIPRMGDNTEPLHSIYSKACIGPIEDLLQSPELAKAQRSEHCSEPAARLRVVHFFHKVRVRYIQEDEVEVFDPQHLSFFNINTPDDLELAQKLTT